MPLVVKGAKLDSVPPDTSMSDRLKVVEASLSTKVMVSLPPCVKLPVPARLTATVGGVVSAGTVL